MAFQMGKNNKSALCIKTFFFYSGVDEKNIVPPAAFITAAVDRNWVH